MSRGLTKFLSLVLVLLLVFTVAAGCSKTKDQTTDSTDDGTGTDVTEPTDDGSDVEEPPVEEEPTYDFGGRTIKIAAWWDPEPQPGSSEGADKTIARRDELKQKYNFDVEYLNIPWDQYLEQFTASTLAGEPFADLPEVGSYWFFPGLVANGFLAPIDDLGFDFGDEKWNKTVLDYGTFNGKKYALGTGRFFPRSGIFFNTTMFEREGLPMVYDLVYDKTWTWDKMLEFAKKLTKDMDGDGVIDQWGLESMDAEWSLIYSNGGKSMEMVDGKPVFTLNQPEAIEALQFWSDLYNVHKVCEPPPDGSAWDYPGQQFQDGKAGMLAYQWWFVDRLYPNMADDYGWVPFPMGPNADNYVSVATETNVTVIPATVAKPEEIAIYYDRMSDPFPDDDPESWREYPESKVRNQESVDMYGHWHDWNISVMDNWRSFKELEELGWGFFWQIKTANKTPQVAIEEVAAQAQAILDDAFKQN